MTPRPSTSTLFPYTTLFRSESLDHNNQKIDDLNLEIERLTNHSDYIDNTVAVSSGILAGIIDSFWVGRSEEHTSELQSRENLVCRLLLEKKKTISTSIRTKP